MKLHKLVTSTSICYTNYFYSCKLPAEISLPKEQVSNAGRCSACSAGDGSSDGCSPLQVLFNLGCVLPVEPLRLLVELGVSLVNVVDVRIVVVRAPATVFFTLFNSVRQRAAIEDLRVTPVALITQNLPIGHICFILAFTYCFSRSATILSTPSFDGT